MPDRYPRTPTYRSWDAMIQRCTNPKATGYAEYGGAGITVCERWRKFEAFLADMGERPDGTSLDRHPDLNGNYEPGNCRWATPREQNLNRAATRYIEFNGERKSLVEWAESLGITTPGMIRRLKRMPLERALTEPKQFGKTEAPQCPQPQAEPMRAVLKPSECGVGVFLERPQPQISSIGIESNVQVNRIPKGSGAVIYHSQPQAEPSPEVERKLRRLLAIRVSGAALYGDDGELQDSSVRPFIDFLRDSPDEISAKLIERNYAALSAEGSVMESRDEA